MTPDQQIPPRAATQTDPEVLSVVAADGTTNQLNLYPAAQPRALILLMPAMGVRAEFYRPIAHGLAAAGWHAVTADLRGIGASSVRASNGAHFGYRELAELDWPANLQCLRDRCPGLPIFLLGHSLGGHINALHAGLEPGATAGLIFVSSGSVYFRGWPFPAALKILGMTQLLRAISATIGYLPGNKIGFGGNEAKGVIRDWAYLARSGQLKPAGASLDYESAMQHYRQPVLAISFSDDTFAPHRATRNLLQKLSAAPVTHLQLQPGDLGLKTVGHYGWVKNHTALVERISAWLTAQLPGQ